MVHLGDGIYVWARESDQSSDVRELVHILRIWDKAHYGMGVRREEVRHI